MADKIHSVSNENYKIRNVISVVLFIFYRSLCNWSLVTFTLRCRVTELNKMEDFDLLAQYLNLNLNFIH